MTPMEVNPYQSPVDSGSMRSGEHNLADRPAARPIGIWILSGLHLLVGLLFLAVTLMLIWALDSDLAMPGNLPTGFVFGLLGLITVLALSSSIGMWRGAAWGWWLAAFYYVWGVLGVVADFLFWLSRSQQLEVESLLGGLPGNLLQLGIHAAILWYLFKGTVRDFFGLRALRVAAALIPLAIMAIVVLIATYFAAYFPAADGQFVP